MTRRRPPPSRLALPLASLLLAPAGTVRTYPVEDAVVALDDGLEQARPAEGTLWVGRTNRGLVVRARLTTALHEVCSRCLRPIVVDLELTVDEEVLPSVDILTGAALDLTAEPDVMRLSPAHELDLERLIREAISLAEPLAPLCRPDCPGLCPVCGADLATNPHRHPEEEVDPRLAPLAALGVDGERGND